MLGPAHELITQIDLTGFVSDVDREEKIAGNNIRVGFDLDVIANIDKTFKKNMMTVSTTYVGEN